MKLKLDENLGNRGAEQLRAAGHDVATVVQQGLTGASDLHLASVCRDESRCLVTLDLDFANPLRFPPEGRAGIAVLRPSGPASAAELTSLVSTLITAMAHHPIFGRLWIVEHGRIP